MLVKRPTLEGMRMKWAPVAPAIRLVSLVLGAGSFGVAWRLTVMGRIDDVPPPFIVVAGLAGLAFTCVALVGRYPASKRQA